MCVTRKFDEHRNKTIIRMRKTPLKFQQHIMRSFENSTQDIRETDGETANDLSREFM